jgi:hypothetical protein
MANNLSFKLKRNNRVAAEYPPLKLDDAAAILANQYKRFCRDSYTTMMQSLEELPPACRYIRIIKDGEETTLDRLVLTMTSGIQSVFQNCLKQLSSAANDTIRSRLFFSAMAELRIGSLAAISSLLHIVNYTHKQWESIEHDTQPTVPSQIISVEDLTENVEYKTTPPPPPRKRPLGTDFIPPKKACLEKSHFKPVYSTYKDEVV